MLQIYLLGSPVICFNGVRLNVKRRIARALLYYLACHPNPVGREELVDLFWQTPGEGDGHNQLRDVLSKLKTQLPDREIIVADREHLGLDFEKVYCDVLDFVSAVAGIQRSTAQTWASAAPVVASHAQIDTAVRLWRSPHFLEGMSLPNAGGYDRWVSEMSARLDQDRLALVAQLADHASAVGDLEMAIQWGRAGLESDACNEELNFKVMSWLEQIGRRSEALDVYKNLRKQFMSEEYGEISPAIQKLYRRILQNPPSGLVESHGGWPVPLSSQAAFIDQTIAALDSIQKAGEAVQDYGETALIAALADAEYHGAVLQSLLGQPDQAEALARSSLKKSELGFYSLGILRARAALARAVYLQGRYADALEEQRRAQETAQNAPDPETLGSLETTAARIYLETGDLDQSCDCIQRAKVHAAHAGPGTALPAEIHFISGAFYQVLEAFPNAIEAHKAGIVEGRTPYDRLMNLFALGRALIFIGETDAGLDLLIEAAQSSREAGLAPIYWQAEIALATWYAGHGMVEHARQIEARTSNEIAGHAIAFWPQRLDYLRANIAFGEGDYERANLLLYTMAHKGRLHSVLWVEMYAYQFLDRIRQVQGLVPLHQDPIRGVITRLAEKALSPAVRPYFENYRNKIMQDLT